MAFYGFRHRKRLSNYINRWFYNLNLSAALGVLNQTICDQMLRLVHSARIEPRNEYVRDWRLRSQFIGECIGTLALLPPPFLRVVSCYDIPYAYEYANLSHKTFMGRPIERSSS